MSVRKWIVRGLVVTVFAFAFVVASGDLPTHDGRTQLPVIALGKESLYRLEVGLVAAYGALLLATPLYNGVIRGRLPTEITARGAKFDEVGESLEDIQGRMETIEGTLRDHAAAVISHRLEIERLKEPR